MNLDFGFVVIDKPSGPTSHQVSDFVKRILNVDKAGHSGTLDPGVTGVLPIGLGGASRLLGLVLKSPKGYVGIMHLHKDVAREKIEAGVKQFVGSIFQMPPVKSAIKRRLRKREIYSFEIIEIEGKDVLFEVFCEAGTYIRKLCHDLGEYLNVGAHMSELRRTKAGPFDESHLTNLHNLKDAYYMYKEKGDDSLLKRIILPAETVAADLPKVVVHESALRSICHGRDLAKPGIIRYDGFEKDQRIALVKIDGTLVALGTALITSSKIGKDGIVVKTEKVFMHED